MRPITMTVYLFADDEENTRKWNVTEWLDDPTVVGWDIDEGHPEGCPGCESNHMEDLGLTYDIVCVTDADSFAWWLVNDAAGESHGGRFMTRDSAEEYAEGNIEMFERIQQEVLS